jgi:hypothetical protein
LRITITLTPADAAVFRDHKKHHGLGFVADAVVCRELVRDGLSAQVPKAAKAKGKK